MYLYLLSFYLLIQSQLGLCSRPQWGAYSALLGSLAGCAKGKGEEVGNFSAPPLLLSCMCPCVCECG